jgi:hypothetical protein
MERWGGRVDLREPPADAAEGAVLEEVHDEDAARDAPDSVHPVASASRLGGEAAVEGPVPDVTEPRR